MQQNTQSPLVSPLEEILKAKGIQVAPGQKETKKKGIATLPAKKFAFAPRQLAKLEQKLTIQSREDLDENRTNLENYRHDIGPWMFDAVSRRRAMFNGTEDEISLAQADINMITSEITAELNQDDPRGRQAAVFAYADAMVTTCPEFRGQVEQTLRDLVSIRFFKEVGEGGHRIYGQDYALAEEFSKNSEAKDVGEKLTKLVNCTVAAGKKRFENDLAVLRAAVGENQLTVADLKSGKEGRMLMETPDHQHRDRFYKGGIMLLESNGGQIRILDGVGGCQRIARLLAGAGTFVWNTQLNSERVQFGREQNLAEEVRRNVLILHGLIFRGIAVAEKAEAADQRKAEFKEQTAAERETLKASATLTLVEVFLFRRAGTTVLDPLGRKPFEVRSRQKDQRSTLVWDVVALIESDGAGRIRVADCPERLNEFFAGFREFVPTGEKFSDVRWPLGNLLRMGYAQALAEATPEQKIAVEAERSQAETARKAAEAEVQTQLATELAAGSGETLEGVQIPDPTEGRS